MATIFLYRKTPDTLNRVTAVTYCLFSVHIILSSVFGLHTAQVDRYMSVESRSATIRSSEASHFKKKPLQSSHDTAKPLVHCPKVHESGSRLSVSSVERNKEETGGN